MAPNDPNLNQALQEFRTAIAILSDESHKSTDEKECSISEACDHFNSACAKLLELIQAKPEVSEVAKAYLLAIKCYIEAHSIPLNGFANVALVCEKPRKEFLATNRSREILNREKESDFVKQMITDSPPAARESMRFRFPFGHHAPPHEADAPSNSRKPQQ
jgi:hypothetical protein